MRKGHISLLLCDFAYITTFLCFQGETSGFISKDSILGGLRRRVEVRGSPEHQKQGEARKWAKARTGVKAHVRAPMTQHDQAGQPCGMAWPCWVAWPCHVEALRELNFLRDFFLGAFHSACFPFFSSCFRVWESDLRESSNLELGLEFMFLD